MQVADPQHSRDSTNSRSDVGLWSGRRQQPSRRFPVHLRRCQLSAGLMSHACEISRNHAYHSSTSTVACANVRLCMLCEPVRSVYSGLLPKRI